MEDAKESKMAKETGVGYLPLMMFFTVVVKLNMEILEIYRRIGLTNSKHELGKACWQF